MFDRGESKDDLELSYHCSSATHSEPEEEEEDLDTLQMGVPLNTGNLALVPEMIYLKKYYFFLILLSGRGRLCTYFYFRRWLINLGLLFRPQFVSLRPKNNSS